MSDTVPTISRVLEDGTLIELIYDPLASTTAFAIGRRDGTTAIEASITLPTGERLVPYSPKNNLIANGCVLLPSDIGEMGDKGDLLSDVQGFLRRYVDISPVFEEIAAFYVLLTWVYDAFNDLPYLRFRGDYGTGKTRALLTVGSIAYKPFFASGASTVSPIFHIQDAFQGTLVLDEADFRFSDATAELTKVLNNGTTRGLPVLRTMTNRHRELNPTAFRVFGPKIVAMRQDFSDRALESRFLTEDTGRRSLRLDIPIHLPAGFADEARALRNRLLGWRLRYRHVLGPDPSRLPGTGSPRLKQMALALLSIIDDEATRSRVCDALSQEGEYSEQAHRDALDTTMVSSILTSFSDCGAPNAPISDVAARFNALSYEALGRPMTNRWIGEFVRRRLRLATVKTGGVYVVPQTERHKVAALAKRLGVEQTP